MIPAIEVFVDLFSTLEQLQIPYVVGGSFASGSWGNPRQTNDLDIAIKIRGDQIGELFESVKDRFMVSLNEIHDALSSNDTYRSFQLLHIQQVFKIDVFVPLPSDYVEEEFARSRQIEFIPGVVANCTAPESVVVQKLRWFELGNRVSDRQWNDIVQVLEVQRGLLDEEFLDRWTKHFGVNELLNQARQQVRA